MFVDKPVWALDLDGVIWRGPHEIVGAAAAVDKLRATGHEVVFVTNSSARTRGQAAAELARHGIGDAENTVVSSAMAVARMIDPAERVLVCGLDGVVDEIARIGATFELVDDVFDPRGFDTVVMGIRNDFDYPMMTTLLRAVQDGARLLATNDDATFPVADGISPGNGALVASVERATGVEATVAGKPYPPMAELLLERFGSEGIMVGDRPDTDGRFAEVVGYDFALVMTGVTGPDDLPVSPAPAVVADDLAALVMALP